MKKTTALGLALLVGAGILVIALKGGEAPAPQDAVAIAARGDFRITVVEEGTFVARESIPLSVDCEALQEQITIVRLVDAGAAVKKGDVLLELDRSPVLRFISQVEMELQAANNE